jgi:glycosyltransferase involved in cell wall biosynthesis
VAVGGGGARPIRALLISHSYVSAELGQGKARELARRPGLQVTVVQPDRFVELNRWMDAERPADRDYELLTLPVAFAEVRGQRHAYLVRRGLLSAIRRARPDVIDLWEEPYSAVSSQVLALRRLAARDARLVLSVSQQSVKRYPPPFSIGERMVLRGTAHLVGRSPEAVEVARAKGYRGPASEIGHGVDLGLFRPRPREEARARLGLEPGPTVGFMGRLVHDKAVDVLIDAVAGLPPQVRLLIVGDGPERADLERRAAAALGPRARFLDGVPIDDVPWVMSAVDVVAMPSRKEPWGRVAIEAMACGTPVVVGGGMLPALVGDHGRVVAPDDAPGLRAALAEALDADAPGRGAFLEAARAHAATHSWTAVAGRWHDVYREVLGR